MKRPKIASVLVCLCLILAFISEPSAQPMKRIKTAEQFKNAVAGKTLWLGKNRVKIKRDGTWSGVYGGEHLGGKWIWENGYWCRTIIQRNHHNDCQKWYSDGKIYKLVRNRGRGKSFIYVAN